MRVIFVRYWVYVACRAITGFFNGGLIVITIVLTSEFVGPSKRCIAFAIISSGWAIGNH